MSMCEGTGMGTCVARLLPALEGYRRGHEAGASVCRYPGTGEPNPTHLNPAELRGPHCGGWSARTVAGEGHFCGGERFTCHGAARITGGTPMVFC